MTREQENAIPGNRDPRAPRGRALVVTALREQTGDRETKGCQKTEENRQHGAT
jgi:hypothetical protein